MSIITVQCGNYANYVGAHYWNQQEMNFQYDNKQAQDVDTVDNDILYREGKTLDREMTYTPRLLAIDLKGSLGTLPELGDLYHKHTVPKLSTLNWYGEASVLKEEPPKKNAFLKELGGDAEQDVDKDADEMIETEDNGTKSKKSKASSTLYNLDSDVGYWSDYLYARFHPKSILVMDDFQHENTTHPFDCYGLGQQVWEEHHHRLGDEVEDRLRFFAEECDNLAGFQVLADAGTGFGGLNAKLVDLLADDYSSKSVLSVPLIPPSMSEYTFTRCGMRLVNTSLSIASCLESGLVTPLSLAESWFPLRSKHTELPLLTYNPDLHYHSSAILAAAFDTASLAYRMKSHRNKFGDIVAGLSDGQRKLAVLSASLPVNIAGELEKDMFTSLTPLLPSSRATKNSSLISKSYPALYTFRGVLTSSLFKRRSDIYSGCGSATEYLETCIHSQNRESNPRLVASLYPLKTGKPFPHLFNPEVSVDGNLLGTDRSKTEGVEIAPVLTSWDTGLAAHNSIKDLGVRAGQIKLDRLPRVTDTGTELDDWREAVEKICQAAEAYVDDDDY